MLGTKRTKRSKRSKPKESVRREGSSCCRIQSTQIAISEANWRFKPRNVQNIAVCRFKFPFQSYPFPSLFRKPNSHKPRHKPRIKPRSKLKPTFDRTKLLLNIVSCTICTSFYRANASDAVKMHPLSLFCSFRNHSSLLIIRIRRIE